MLTVIRDAGLDKNRHKLVSIHCDACNGYKVMRESNMKRAKSCGCLERAEFRKRNFPKTFTEPKGFWSQWWKAPLSPKEICRQARVALKGEPYTPFAKLTRKNRYAA